MAETERSFADLQTLLADNTVEAISAQDLRDAVVSALGGYASLYVDGGVAVQSLTATPAKLAAFAGAGPARGATASHVNDEITLGTAGDYAVSFQASLTANVSTVLDLELRLGGIKVTGAAARVQAGTTSVSCSICLPVAASIGGLLSVYASAAPNADLTVRHAQLVAKRVG